jgi:hypothetical protein
MRHLPAVLTTLLLASALGACGAGLHGDVFRGDGYAFRLGPLPAGFHRVAVDRASLAFRDDADGGTIAVNGRCGLDGEDVPLATLTQHLFLRFTEQEILEQTILPFDHREAMRTVIRAKLDGVPMKFAVWVLKKDGCVYDLAYMAAPERFDRDAAAFDRFARGFTTVTSHD